jgi:malate synthase
MTSHPVLDIRGALTPAYKEIWTPDACRFIADLNSRFNPRRLALLAARVERQKQFDAGVMPDFLAETRPVREAAWTVASIPADLRDRRVEITGPVERKMIINALNAGARVFMADFEDSSSPTWEAMIDGQINIRDAIAGTITYRSPEHKHYQLNATTSVLMVRPRGWHLEEKHVLQDGQPLSGSLTDFGLFFFHNVKALMAKGTAPYFYLPKMESHLEARLWNDVFVFAQQALGIAQGTIRATVLIETLPAAFEMDEILYELRDHAAGLNCGRWDYIFNFIKCFRNHADFVLPERGQVTMTTHFLRSYSKLLIKTCHRRGIHGMGGMAAQIPIKEPVANEQAMVKVRADKLREVTDGHDGTWVGHPGLVPVAMDIFNQHMPTPNQIERKRDDIEITASDLIKVPEGTITLTGLRNNINVSLWYIEAWLRGQGCVPLHNLMEDAATAEIARTQIWQWIRYPKGVLDDGRKITAVLVREILADELATAKQQTVADTTRIFDSAAQLLDRLTISDTLSNFLTLDAYAFLP